MKPSSGGGRIDWPVSGWPKHGPLVLAFLAVLLALLLALFLLADTQSELEPGVRETASEQSDPP